MNVYDYKTNKGGNVLTNTINLLERKFRFGADHEIQTKYSVDAKSGLGVRFLTNSENIEIILQLESNATVRQHVGNSLSNGIYYCISDSKGKLITQNICINKEVENKHTLFANKHAKDIQCEIFFPILNKIDKLMLDLNDGASIEAINRKNIVVCGGKLSYGIGCTFANAMYSNTIARRLYCNPVNLSVFNSNKFYSDIGKNACEYSPVAIITECGCKQNSPDYLRDNLYEYLKNLVNYNPQSWIIVLGEDNWYMNENKKLRKEMELDIVSQIKHKTKHNMLYISLGDVFHNKTTDMLTYSSNFYNDYANYEIAKYLIPVLKACIVAQNS